MRSSNISSLLKNSPISMLNFYLKYLNTQLKAYKKYTENGENLSKDLILMNWLRVLRVIRWNGAPQILILPELNFKLVISMSITLIMKMVNLWCLVWLFVCKVTTKLPNHPEALLLTKTLIPISTLF